MADHSDTLHRVCAQLLAGRTGEAKEIARSEYPFTRSEAHQRRYTELQSLGIFVRDGFVDRYSGKRLIFPGTLRLLTQLLPEEFPFHPNWKMGESHIVYWELFPTIDHVIPVARGGHDTESNWVTTSMLRNSAKSGWTLEELGWEVAPPGHLAEWDGLTSWFCRYARQAPEAVSTPYLTRWHRAAEQLIQL